MVVTAYIVSNISSSGGDGGGCRSSSSGGSSSGRLSCYTVGSGNALSATTIAVLENIKPLRA